MELPVMSDLHINAFLGGEITDLESGMLNAVVVKSAAGDYVTQRPSIDVFEDASVTVTKQGGRGIYYWAGNAALYFVNDNTIYKGTYGTVIGAITAGTQKCYFFEIGGLLVLLDPQNNQGWTIAAGGTFTQITDVDFPPKQTPAVGLVFGGAVLNGYLYVLDEDGSIYNSDLENAATWNALGFINAERQPDGGVYLGLHHDNIVAFGPRSIEFFYHADIAAPASPLARRQDVYYTLGCVSGESVSQEGDLIYFMGSSAGALGIYVLENFIPRKISTPTIDAFLTKSVVNDGYSALGANISSQGRTYYVLTIYLLSTIVQPKISLAYDVLTGLWCEYTTVVVGQGKFPIVAWTTRTGSVPRTGEGIFANGDLFTVIDNQTPLDTIGGTGWIQPGWIQSGWIESAVVSGSNGVAIQMKSRLGMYNAGLTAAKKVVNLLPVADKTAASNTLTVRWSDENSKSFNAGRTVDTSIYEKMNATGSFRRRNFELEYAGSERVKLYALEGQIIPGIK